LQVVILHSFSKIHFFFNASFPVPLIQFQKATHMTSINPNGVDKLRENTLQKRIRNYFHVYSIYLSLFKDTSNFQCTLELTVQRRMCLSIINNQIAIPLKLLQTRHDDLRITWSPRSRSIK